MNYTKLITKKKQYKYSVNICLDLRTEERLADFIPNLTTTEIIREYLGGIIRGNSDTHSRILYGSYGTGKSHLLTVMSAILGHINTNGKGFKSFTQLIANYDKELSADIRTFAKEEKPYMVVPIYADYDDFGKCITFSLKKELEKNNISVCFKGYYDEALSLLEKWMEGEESSSRLTEECAKQNIKVKDLQKGLSTYNDSYEKVFNAIYAGMTYGAVFNSTAGNLIDNLNAANEAIKDKFRGIVIIFDEFGRYVEDYGETLKVKAVQDLAEYCDHSDYDNYVILVSHKVLSLYTSSMKKGISDEWKKVEGRFKPTSINIKYDQCLSLIGHIIPKTGQWKENTRLLAMTLASNLTGRIVFREDVFEFFHDKGIITFIDSSQGAGKIRLSMKAMKIDFLAFTGHKDLMAIPGVGGLCCESSEHFEPFTYKGQSSCSRAWLWCQVAA